MPDPRALLRSRSYVQLLVLAALVGVPISALAYGFLKLVDVVQTAIFEDLPDQLGYDPVPAWWPLPVLVLAGVLTALAITLLPGSGGHSPADGFKATGPVPPIELPGILAAALASLGFGVVLGPEAPLILMGSGLGVLAVRLAARDTPEQAAAIIAAAGSFAAISSLLGSPLLGAFLLLEASGLGGPMLGLVLLPGLLAAGVGSLVFVGLDSLTGFGTLSLAIPGLPPVGHPTGTWFAWALAIGLVAPFLGRGISLLAVAVRARAEEHLLLTMPALGLLIGGLAVGFDQATDHSASDVLFSGQTALGPLIGGASTWSVGALLALLAAKGIAYSLSLSTFRGGPVFPAMFLGAATGIAASHLPGLPLIPAVAMGIGAMCTTMLTLPLTSTLLATLLLGTDGTNVMPVVIVAVVVSHVITARLTPLPAPAGEPASPAAGAAPAPSLTHSPG
ncbi:MAG TPA: chloride channel protein [Baekduia sp.]|uniref:chloride channel protein n=1 Tax=Baekduia sp. TaxID=2600305 RepID=UPI002D0468DC|nr:chloride channel protein [Baekduia sp.]HMJ36676.1 chloride channel protein [Baekduia sp.]